MASTKTKKRPSDGEIRQSQLLTTFGPGAMVDLPERSVVIGGLNYWHGQQDIITEERLRYKVNKLIEKQTGTWPNLELRTPPQPYGPNDSRQHRIDAFIFPAWFLGQIEQNYYAHGKTYRTRPLRPWSGVGSDEKFEGKKTQWVPVRFVQACVNGHLSDIEWRAFAHSDFSSRCPQQLWLDEAGTGNDFEEIYVRCECGARRPLSQAKIKDGRILGDCSGKMPWLKDHWEPCIGRVRDSQTGDLKETGRPEPNRLLVRSASNAYFSHTLSVISLPDKTHELSKALDQFYTGDLEEEEDIDGLANTLKKKRYTPLNPFKLETIWAAIQSRKAGTSPDSQNRPIKVVELETLLQAPLEQSAEAQQNRNQDDLDFEAARRSRDSIQAPWQPFLSEVVLVHRLREVIAQVGFTRFESSLPDVEEGELDLNPRRAALGREITWVPTIENKGEGIFLAFDRNKIEAWTDREQPKARNEQLYASYLKYLDSRGIPRDQAKYPGLPYILLHTLSHLLITEIALDCGYSASAIKERIYAIPDTGYGILLYTSTAGSEGSLGGLVHLGHTIENHLRRALQRGRLCSNDPICAQHNPENLDEDRFLHGAACHGCLLVAETSCENRNEFLDRALVINTVASAQTAFFPDPLSGL